MKFIHFITLGFALVSCNLLAQNSYAEDYTPIKYKGTIPTEFLEDQKEYTLSELKSKNHSLSKSNAKEFYTASNFIINSFLNSGFVYYNDPISEYVNEVGQQVLAEVDDPKKKDVRFFITRLDETNAFCWRNGFIFINIGLIDKLETEAELAFVLSHEVSHYLKNHSINYYQKTKDLAKLTRKEKKALKKIQKKLGDVTPAEILKDMEALYFSREQELEADMHGFEIYAKTSYNSAAALQALQLFENLSQVDSFFLPMDIYKHFNIDSVWTVDTSDVYKPSRSSERLNSQDTIFFKPSTVILSDTFSTHPAIETRIDSMRNQVQALNGSKGSDFIVGEQSWNAIKEMVKFEKLEFFDRTKDYGSLLYTTLYLLDEYPNNVYLKKKKAKALYSLAYADYFVDFNDRYKNRKVESDKAYFYHYLANALSSNHFVVSQLEHLYLTNSAPEFGIYYARAMELSTTGAAKSRKVYKSIDSDSEGLSSFIKTKSK